MSFSFHMKKKTSFCDVALWASLMDHTSLSIGDSARDQVYLISPANRRDGPLRQIDSVKN